MIEKTDFAHWLRIGLGRAVLHMMDHDSIPYRDLILNACLHHLGYYVGLESSRAVYMFDLISRTPDLEFYSDALLNELMKFETMDHKQFENHHYDIEQTYDLVALIARNGNQKVRNALYRQFDSHFAFGNFIAAQAILTADGLDGFKNIAERLDVLVREHGTRFESNEDDAYYLHGDLLEPLMEFVEEKEFPELVGRLRRENPNFTFLLDTLEKDWYQRRGNPSPRPASPDNRSYNEIYPLLQNPVFRERFIQMRKWGKTASTDDLHCAALDLLQAEDDEIILNYLCIFQKRPFPLDPTPLIQFARHENENAQHKNENIVWRSLSALAELQHPAVRDFALESIESEYFPEYTVGLLEHNFEPGDWVRINQLTEQDFDAEEMHALGANICSVFDSHPSTDAIPSLLNLYELNVCAVCRETTVKCLDQLDQIPDWMRAELRYDSNLDIRRGFADI